MFNSIYEVKIEGKDIKRFIKSLYRRKIEIINILYGEDNVLLKLDKDNYQRLLEIKTIYEVKLTELYGFVKCKWLFDKYKIFLLSVCFGFLLLFLLSNIIFSVEVIHRKGEIRKLIYKELERYHIEKYNLRVSFSKQEEIVKNILDNNKDKIEWLEIERVGVKYIVRVEERIINNIPEESQKRHVVASKDGIIMHIDASKGEIVKRINDYVKKGDIIISGNITKSEEIKNSIAAEGNVYAEVWYEVDVEMPLAYREEYKTGKTKNTLTLSFLNKSFSLFDLKPYKNKKIVENIIFKNNILPIKLSYNKEEELKVIDEVYTRDEAIEKAIELARKKLSVKLDDGEKILYEKKLKTKENNSTILVTVFFKVYENITSYQDIIDDVEENNIAR
ncbi:MAG: sporulation protein YqfD [Bacilli bacterium]|nr:sporulation protein YqfD [Bacilli bacterium]